MYNPRVLLNFPRNPQRTRMAAPATAEKTTAAIAPTLVFILRGVAALEVLDALAAEEEPEPEPVLVETIVLVPEEVIVVPKAEVVVVTRVVALAGEVAVPLLPVAEVVETALEVELDEAAAVLAPTLN